MSELSRNSVVERVSNRLLYVVSMNHAFNDGSVFFLSSLFPVVISLFGLSVFEVGVLVAVGYLVNVIFQPIVGRFAEKADAKKLLALGISVISFSVISFVPSTGFSTLLASVVLLRIGTSFFHPVGVSAITWTYAGKRLERALGFQSAFGNFGILIVFLAAAPLYLVLGWKSTFFGLGAVGFAVTLITLLALGRISIKRFSGDEQGGDSPNEKPNHGRFGIPTFFIVAGFASGGSFALILNFANIFLEGRNNLSTSEANLLVSVWIAAAFVGAIVSGASQKRFDRLALLSLYFFLPSVLVVLLVLVDSIGLVTLSLLLTGFTISGTYPLTQAELSDYLGREESKKGRSFGILFSAQTIGASVMGLVGGYLSEVLGLAHSFDVVVVSMLFAGGLTLLWKVRKPVSSLSSSGQVTSEAKRSQLMPRISRNSSGQSAGSSKNSETL
ncbi:MAG: MFS transporter [Thaumarchaeota archaeon]|nr:MFS transporter [Nitrososphaerota archaeon]